MAFVLKLCVFVVFLIILQDSGNALQCYQCINVESDTSSSFLGDAFSGKTDPDCENPSSWDDTKVKYCADDGSQMCGLVTGSTTFNLPLGGSIITSLQVRDCMNAPGMSTGCQGTQEQKDLLNGVLALAKFSDLTVDGDVCFCDTDLCDPGCKGWKLGDLCLTWVIIGGVGAGVFVVLVLLVTCCCCCCCQCCRKNGSQGRVITTVPTVITTTVPYSAFGNAEGQYVNPTYGVNTMAMKPPV